MGFADAELKADWCRTAIQKADADRSDLVVMLPPFEKRVGVGGVVDLPNRFDIPSLLGCPSKPLDKEQSSQCYQWESIVFQCSVRAASRS
jgi:hypothetical protein